MKISPINSLNININAKTSVVAEKPNFRIKNDSFVSSSLAFKGKFPYASSGLSLSGLSTKEISKFLDHIGYVVNQSHQKNYIDNSCYFYLSQMINDKNTTIHVIRDSSKQIVGSGIVSFHKDRGEISCLYVRPEWQNKGLATWMLGDFLSKAKEKNISSLILATENLQAKTLYQKFGFKTLCKCEKQNVDIMIHGKYPFYFDFLKFLPQKYKEDFYQKY